MRVAERGKLNVQERNHVLPVRLIIVNVYLVGLQQYRRPLLMSRMILIIIVVATIDISINHHLIQILKVI